MVIRLASVPHSFLEDKVGGNTADMYNGTCVDFDGTDAWVTIWRCRRFWMGYQPSVYLVGFILIKTLLITLQCLLLKTIH